MPEMSTLEHLQKLVAIFIAYIYGKAAKFYQFSLVKRCYFQMYCQKNNLILNNFIHLLPTDTDGVISRVLQQHLHLWDRLPLLLLPWHISQVLVPALQTWPEETLRQMQVLQLQQL